MSPGGAGAAYVLGPPKLSAAETQLEEAKARPINATDARPAPRTSRQPVKTGATEAARKPLQGQPLPQHTQQSATMALDDDDEDPEAAMRAYMEKTQINKDKGGPRRTLVERASDNTQGGADAFKQSERIIKSTQAMTDGLKLKRKTAADEMEADSKEMARLDRELDEFRRKYDAVCQSYDDNVAKRNHLRATLADAKKQMDDMQTTCGEWAARNRRDQYKFNSKLVSEELRELRGYSVEPGSTCTRKEAQSRTRTSRTLQTNREQSQQDQLAELMRQTKAKARALAKGKK